MGVEKILVKYKAENISDIFKNTGEDAVDIFQKAIAKREEPSTFTAENILGPGGGVDFRDNFNWKITQFKSL